MKYLLLAVGDERPWAEAGPQERHALYAEWGRFEAMLAERRAHHGGFELAPSPTATTVRKHGGQVLITDGPYAETVEQISGYVVVEAASMEEAVELAGQMPSDVHVREIAG
ncbi:YciI family protein [Nonomuraea longicatena]|uniref:YciI family protein n=1 Tax=Nonomuraea longicatena TaxID=83682 RepID=A0ABN1PYV5_9ACTN